MGKISPSTSKLLYSIQQKKRQIPSPEDQKPVAKKKDLVAVIMNDNSSHNDAEMSDVESFSSANHQDGMTDREIEEDLKAIESTKNFEVNNAASQNELLQEQAQVRNQMSFNEKDMVKIVEQVVNRKIESIVNTQTQINISVSSIHTAINRQSTVISTLREKCAALQTTLDLDRKNTTEVIEEKVKSKIEEAFQSAWFSDNFTKASSSTGRCSSSSLGKRSLENAPEIMEISDETTTQSVNNIKAGVSPNILNYDITKLLGLRHQSSASVVVIYAVKYPEEVITGKMATEKIEPALRLELSAMEVEIRDLQLRSRYGVILVTCNSSSEQAEIMTAVEEIKWNDLKLSECKSMIIEKFQLFPVIELSLPDHPSSHEQAVKLANSSLQSLNFDSSKWSWVFSPRPAAPNQRRTSNRDSLQSPPASHLFVVNPETEWKLLAQPGNILNIPYKIKNRLESSSHIAFLKIPQNYAAGETLLAAGIKNQPCAKSIKKKKMEEKREQLLEFIRQQKGSENSD